MMLIGVVLFDGGRNREIKVIANLKKQKDGTVKELFNYALAKHVAPGSTFKLASIIAGLEDGVFSIDDSIKLTEGDTLFMIEL